MMSVATKSPGVSAAYLMIKRREVGERPRYEVNSLGQLRVGGIGPPEGALVVMTNAVAAGMPLPQC